MEKTYVTTCRSRDPVRDAVNASKDRRYKGKKLSAMLRVGDAATEAGYGFCFVGVGGDGLDEASEFEDFANVAGGIEEFQAAGIAFERDEGADERADSGAVHLHHASKIDENIARRNFREASQFGTESIVAAANRDAALQIEDRDVPGLSRRYLQAHVLLPGVRDNARRRVRIITL